MRTASNNLNFVFRTKDTTFTSKFDLHVSAASIPDIHCQRFWFMNLKVVADNHGPRNTIKYLLLICFIQFLVLSLIKEQLDIHYKCCAKCKMYRFGYSPMFLIAKINFPKTRLKIIYGLFPALFSIRHPNIQGKPKLNSTYYENYHLKFMFKITYKTFLLNLSWDISCLNIFITFSRILYLSSSCLIKNYFCLPQENQKSFLLSYSESG